MRRRGRLQIGRWALCRRQEARRQECRRAASGGFPERQCRPGRPPQGRILHRTAIARRGRGESADGRGWLGRPRTCRSG